MQERFLLFSAAGEKLALKLQEIAEVMEPQETFPVPRVPSHFSGVMNFHGTLTAEVDLSLYFGRAGRTRAGKVLVLEVKGAHLALRVDAVGSIIPREAIVEESPGEDALTSSLIRTEQGTFRLLQLESLIFALEQGL